jgi:hypothetical protein
MSSIEFFKDFQCCPHLPDPGILMTQMFTQFSEQAPAHCPLSTTFFSLLFGGVALTSTALPWSFPALQCSRFWFLYFYF